MGVSSQVVSFFRAGRREWARADFSASPFFSMEGAGVPTLLASGEESAAQVKGESVLKYAPDSQAAKAYRQLAREVLNGKKI